MRTLAVRHPAAAVAVLALAAVGVLVDQPGAGARSPALMQPTAAGARPAAPARVPRVHAGMRYLALGDSVVFGYRESANLPTPDYTKPASFVGYPEVVAADLGLRLTNAACPGETTASLIDSARQSNGCENRFDPAEANPVAGGYRSVYPLHVGYDGSQLAFAEKFLLAHPRTGLVSLTAGANDAYLCVQRTSDNCLSELSSLERSITRHVERILKGLRRKAHYAGQIVLVNYYSPDYTSTFQTAGASGINGALETAAKAYGAKVASGFDAFQTAAAQASGNTCTAQLITTLTTGGCGVHPSVAGQSLLAQALERRVKK